MQVKPADPPRGEPAADSERIFVSYIGEVSNLHKALCSVEKSSDIAVQFYLLEDSERVIPSATPAIVPIVAMPGRKFLFLCGSPAAAGAERHPLRKIEKGEQVRILRIRRTTPRERSRAMQVA